MNVREKLLAKVTNALHEHRIDEDTVVYLRSFSFNDKVSLSDASPKNFDDNVLMTPEEKAKAESDEEKRVYRDVATAALLGCVVDEKGNPVFTQADLPALFADPKDTVSTIVKRVTEISGMGKVAGNGSPGAIQDSSGSDFA